MHSYLQNSLNTCGMYSIDVKDICEITSKTIKISGFEFFDMFESKRMVIEVLC